MNSAALSPPILARPPGDARRGALIILPGAAGPGRWTDDLGAVFAEEGYEVLILARRRGDGSSAARVNAARDKLLGPVFLLAFDGDADWALQARGLFSGFTAASLVCSAAAGLDGIETPACPLILHRTRPEGAEAPLEIERFAERHPEIALWVYDAAIEFASPDPSRADSAILALLRTRQHFHRSGGLREAGA